MRLLRKVTYRAQLILLIITFAFFIGLTDLYYMSEFSRVVKDRESAYMQSVIDDTDNWLDQMSLGFRNAATEIKNNATVQNYMSTKTSRAKASYRVSLYETMRLVCASSPFINGMLLLDPDGTISSMNLVAPIIVLEALSEQYDLKALEADVLTPMMQVPNAFNGTPFACYISPVIGAENPSLRSACIFVFQMHDRQFNNYITGSSLTENSQFYLLDSLNKIVYSRLPVDDLGKAESDIASIISSNLDNGSEMVLQNARSLVFTGVNDQLGWRSVSIVPVQEINMELRVIQRIAFAIGIGSFVIFVAIGLIFIWNMSRPLSLLLTNLRYMGETNLSKRLPVLYENEIGVITREINGMMDKIQNMTETSFAMRNKMYESELNLKNAELRALQSQINPHFLYNTLECIRSIALVEGIPSIATISESMAGIFRYSISGGLLSTVEREVECARSYIEIISIRFGGRIAFSFHIDPEVLNEPMVKITLQPIVENAVQHGLSEVEEGGVVDVSGYIQDDFIIFTVSDNGAGMDAQIVERLNESFIQRENKGMLMPDESNHTSIGLANINSRIRAYYGEPYGIHVESSPGNGTAVTLRMPMNAGL